MKKKHITKTKAGFTIIEISIVIIVIGLLVVGVIGGREIIKQSELSSITTEYNEYRQAINAFELKYNGLPGDLKDATEYFGAMAGSLPFGWDSDCVNFMGQGVPSSGNETCSGNGDGIIEHYLETLQAWKQLSSAGLIKGVYSGVVATDVEIQPYKVGFNLPRSKNFEAGWNFSGRDINWFSDPIKNINNGFCFGEMPGNDDTSCITQPALTPEDAYSVDIKTDDGKPNAGKILGFAWGNCYADSNPDTDYNFTYKEKACSLIFDSN